MIQLAIIVLSLFFLISFKTNIPNFPFHRLFIFIFDLQLEVLKISFI
jgi:hypothetical protein